VIKNSNSENFLVPEGSLGIDMHFLIYVDGFVGIYLYIDIVYVKAITTFIYLLSSTDNSYFNENMVAEFT
jgi:hypothetical protein